MNARLLLPLACAVACALVAASLALLADGPPAPAGDLGSSAAGVPERVEEELVAVPGAASERGSPAVAPPGARDPVASDEARVAGSVARPASSPGGPPRVALFRARMGEPAGVIAEASCAVDGRFSLSTKEDVRDVLLVVHARGSRPETRALELVRGRELELAPIAIDAGAVVAGSIRAGGEPLVRAEVVAVLVGERERFPVEGGALVWRGGRFEWAFATALSEPDGSYRVGGLVAERYDVRLSSMRERAVLGFVGPGARRLEAPAEGVDFACDVATIALRFVSDDAPVAGVDVELASAGWTLSGVTDHEGRVAFRTLPSLDLRLVARKPGFDPLAAPLAAPRAAEHREESLFLRAHPKPSELRLSLDGAAPATSIALTFAEPGTAARRFDVSYAAGEKFDPRARMLEGVLRVEVPPGLWAVTVRAGRSPGTPDLEDGERPPGPLVCPERFTSRFEPGKVVEHRFAPQAWPMVTIEVLDESGRLARSRVEMKRSFGIEIAGAEAILAGPGEALPYVVSSPDRPVEHPAPLCDGLLELRAVADGRASDWQAVRFVPGGAPQRLRFVLPSP